MAPLTYLKSYKAVKIQLPRAVRVWVEGNATVLESEGGPVATMAAKVRTDRPRRFGYAIVKLTRPECDALWIVTDGLATCLEPDRNTDMRSRNELRACHNMLDDLAEADRIFDRWEGAR